MTAGLWAGGAHAPGCFCLIPLRNSLALTAALREGLRGRRGPGEARAGQAPQLLQVLREDSCDQVGVETPGIQAEVAEVDRERVDQQPSRAHERSSGGKSLEGPGGEVPWRDLEGSLEEVPGGSPWRDLEGERWLTGGPRAQAKATRCAHHRDTSPMPDQRRL